MRTNFSSKLLRLSPDLWKINVVGRNWRYYSCNIYIIDNVKGMFLGTFSRGYYILILYRVP